MAAKPTCPGLQGTNSTVTFVHADTTTFREIVQRLTGPREESHPPSPSPSPRTSTTPPASPKFTGVRRSGFKVSRTNLKITDLGFIDHPSSPVGSMSPSSDALSSLMSPSKDLAKLASLVMNREEEEKAIMSPSSQTKKIQEPQLLPLFPLTSPKSTQL